MDITVEAQRRWETTPRGKIICPECGMKGYLGCKWVRKHAEHIVCTCGRTVSKEGQWAHRGSMARWGHPCPQESQGSAAESDVEVDEDWHGEWDGRDVD